MCLPLELKPLIAKNHQRFMTFVGQLTQPETFAEGQFFHVVQVLCAGAVSEFERLQAAYNEEDDVLLGWACRNLLELTIFAKFCSMSRANALSFAADRLIDTKQILRQFRTLELHLSPSQPDSIFDDQMSAIEAQMQSEGIRRDTYLRAGELAEQVGLSTEYKSLNQICSKLVHPTAWSCFTADQGSGRITRSLDLFLVAGANFYNEVYVAFSKYFDSEGRLLELPPEGRVGSKG